METTRSSRPATAFVLAGGGSLGAVEVGMLQVLVEAGIFPDFVVGASVGAINGIHFAAAPNSRGVERLAEIWCRIGRRELNGEFTRRSSEGHFATAVLATYFAPNDHLIVVNAGHPPPLWYRSERETRELLEAPQPRTSEIADTIQVGVSNLPLGIIDPTPYAQFAVPLEPDDLVVFYTDASIETRGPKGELLGTSGLLELVRSLDVFAFETLSGSIRDALDILRGGEPADDDLTVLVLHHNAADPPHLSLSKRLRVLARMMGIGRIEPRL